MERNRRACVRMPETHTYLLNYGSVQLVVEISRIDVQYSSMMDRMVGKSPNTVQPTVLYSGHYFDCKSNVSVIRVSKLFHSKISMDKCRTDAM